MTAKKEVHFFFQIYFGTAHARIYLVADLFGINCATGMSALMRKSLIDDAGGLKAFGCYLAEDYFLAKAVMDRGKKTSISRQPAWQNPGTCQIPSFQKRVTRWAKLRIAMVPTTIIFEPMSECMMLGALAAWANYWLFQWDPVAIYLMHVLVWFLLDYILLTIVQVLIIIFYKANDDRRLNLVVILFLPKTERIFAFQKVWICSRLVLARIERAVFVFECALSSDNPVESRRLSSQVGGSGRRVETKRETMTVDEARHECSYAVK